MHAVGTAAARLAAPIVARHGGGALARLKAEWPAIAGADLAAVSWPESLSREGSLKLRVLPSSALEVQHRAPLAVERINLFFGRTVVARLALIQGPLPLPPRPRAPRRELSPDRTAALDDQVAAVADPELRAALAGLGRAILATPESEG